LHVVVVLSAGLNVFTVVSEAPVQKSKHNLLCVGVELLALLRVTHVAVISYTARTFVRHVEGLSLLRLKLRVESTVKLVRLLTLRVLLCIFLVREIVGNHAVDMI
jgi:hypothetical protein